MPPVDQQQTTASPSPSSLSDSTLERLQRRVCGWPRSRAFFLHHFSLRSTGIAAQRIESWMGEGAPRPSTAAPPPPSPRTPLLLRKQNGDREAAVDSEIARVNKLPAHSSYAIHRMKVLNKLRHLLSIKRTTSQDEELELLFASLSI
ncbi:uncharacterized protein C2845_PM02G08430 [Panicum miliaceum]|uniref:Uncharacterized protein n=1 Tax=Panicum miliaceum TaxID=4540 RepID=A0A3L6S999_PANMI|nr:uncharacterized protein C2845_PM02G08430 [Panicum miliaceum]